MPYPIDTLQYPFQKRLRQLLKPIEVINLQRATGHFQDNKYLLPIVSFQRVSKITFHKFRNHAIELWYNYDYAGSRNGYDVLEPYQVEMYGMDEADLSYEPFQCMSFQYLDDLEISFCNITTNFLTTLAQKKVDTIQNIWITSRLYEENLKLSWILSLFPSAVTFRFQYIVMPGWVQDLVEYGNTNLEEMVVVSDIADDLFSFQTLELYQFVKAQNDNFKLELQYYGKEDTDVVKSKALLDKMYFKECKYEERSVDISINNEWMQFFALQ